MRTVTAEPESKPLSIVEALALSGASRTALYQAIADKHLAAFKMGRRTVIFKADLYSWLRRLPVR